MSTIARMLLVALLLVAAPARSAEETIALLPIGAAGRPENAQLLMTALLESFKRRGFTIVPTTKVEEGLKRRQINLKAGVALRELGALRTDLSADYVIYVRILTEGINQLTPARDLVLTFRSNIILNGVGTSDSDFFHTNEIGQVFAPGDGGQTPVMVKADAEEAAARLLEGFYARLRKSRKLTGN